jgi:hypothetical protein
VPGEPEPGSAGAYLAWNSQMIRGEAEFVPNGSYVLADSVVYGRLAGFVSASRPVFTNSIHLDLRPAWRRLGADPCHRNQLDAKPTIRPSALRSMLDERMAI